LCWEKWIDKAAFSSQLSAVSFFEGKITAQIFGSIKRVAEQEKAEG
jgi:hypothetical protein